MLKLLREDGDGDDTVWGVYLFLYDIDFIEQFTEAPLSLFIIITQ